MGAVQMDPDDARASLLEQCREIRAGVQRLGDKLDQVEAKVRQLFPVDPPRPSSRLASASDDAGGAR